MDFGTVRKKLARNAYRSFEQFEVRFLDSGRIFRQQMDNGILYCDLLAVEQLLFSSFFAFVVSDFDV